MPGHIIPIRLPKFIAGPVWVTFSKPHPNISTFTLVQSDLVAEAERDVPTATDTEPRVPLHVNNIELSEVEYLGHIVSAKGLRPNPSKLRAVEEFPTPRTPRELRHKLINSNRF